MRDGGMEGTRDGGREKWRMAVVDEPVALLRLMLSLMLLNSVLAAVSSAASERQDHAPRRTPRHGRTCPSRRWQWGCSRSGSRRGPPWRLRLVVSSNV